MTYRSILTNSIFYLPKHVSHHQCNLVVILVEHIILLLLLMSASKQLI